MDYGKLNVEEIKRGYRFDDQVGAYCCNYCGKRFYEGQVYPMGDAFLMPETAMRTHIEQEHEGPFAENLDGGEKYNTFTNTQKELLRLFRSGLSDKDIARQLGVAASTVRHQKFSFREKAKQAKYYLAVYEEVFEPEAEQRSDDTMMSIPNSVTMMDDRYEITEKERARILDIEFESLDPLKLKNFTFKAKKQVAVLSRIAEEFEPGRRYSEAEVRDILSEIYPDHSILRRHLVDYGFMARTPDGAEYWLN